MTSMQRMTCGVKHAVNILCALAVNHTVEHLVIEIGIGGQISCQFPKLGMILIPIHIDLVDLQMHCTSPPIRAISQPCETE